MSRGGGLTLYLGGLADAPVAELLALLEPFSPVLIHPAIAPGGHVPLGYAFARFRSATEAARARMALQGARLAGRGLMVAWAKGEAAVGLVRDQAGAWRPGRIDATGCPAWP